MLVDDSYRPQAPRKLLAPLLRSKLGTTFGRLMPAIDIAPVASRGGVSRFVDVPWHIRDLTDAPQWVPPLRVAVLDALDEKKNPFYRNAARRLFIAMRSGRPVGRIAAIENRAHNEFHNDRVGFFGFFESIDDTGVAQTLLSEAASWLRAR